MEKITFVNGQAPFLNEQNLNQLQTNIENAIEAAKNEVNENIPTKITDLENDSTFLAKNDDFNRITGRVHITNGFDDYQERKVDLSLGYLIGAESGGLPGTLHINEKCDTDVHVLKGGEGTLFYKEKEVATQEYVDEQIANIETTGGGISEIPIASATTLGGIKVGANLTIDEDGTLNANSGGSGSGSDYELPIASTETLGGIKVGANLSIDENGVLSANSSGSSSHIYSTEEKIVGTWVDGRPLYERTLMGNSPSKANTDYVAATLTGVDVVTDIKGFYQVSAYVNNKNYYYTFYVNTWYNSTTYLSVFYKGETEQLIMLSGSQYLNKPFTITIQYTKSED